MGSVAAHAPVAKRRWCPRPWSRLLHGHARSDGAAPRSVSEESALPAAGRAYAHVGSLDRHVSFGESPRVQPDEFRALALAQLDAVYRLASHLARNRDEANDLAQETYLRAFRSAASYRPADHGMRPWLFKILHNVFHSRLAKDARDHAAADGAGHEPPPAPPPAGAGGGGAETRADAVDWDEVDERLKAAIQELSIPHRTAFLLCAVEGLGYREIAEITDVPVGTVMSRLYRARAILAARLAGLAAECGMGRAKRAGEGGIDPPS